MHEGLLFGMVGVWDGEIGYGLLSVVTTFWHSLMRLDAWEHNGAMSTQTRSFPKRLDMIGRSKYLQSEIIETISNMFFVQFISIYIIFKGCQWSVPRLRMHKLFRLSAACRSWRVKLPGRRLPSGTQRLCSLNGKHYGKTHFEKLVFYLLMLILCWFYVDFMYGRLYESRRNKSFNHVPVYI